MAPQATGHDATKAPRWPVCRVGDGRRSSKWRSFACSRPLLPWEGKRKDFPCRCACTQWMRKPCIPLFFRTFPLFGIFFSLPNSRQIKHHSTTSRGIGIWIVRSALNFSHSRSRDAASPCADTAAGSVQRGNRSGRIWACWRVEGTASWRASVWVGEFGLLSSGFEGSDTV